MFEWTNYAYLDVVLTNRKWKLEQDYSEMAKAYRPSHADATYDFKYGIRAVQVPFIFFLLILFFHWCTHNYD
jgi:chorismate synthase